MTEPRTVTTIEIAGDEYTVRSEASREYTLECARYVNDAIAEVMSRGSLVEAHKAAILAALALADQLFQARAEADSLRLALAENARQLAADVDKVLSADGVASPDT